MDDFTKRVVDSATSPKYKLTQEIKAHQEKLTAHQAFIAGNPIFAELSTREITLMIEQEQVMRHLLFILQSRLELMTGGAA